MFAGSRGTRLLQKMEGAAGGGSSAAAKPGSAPISEGMRVASRARLVQAMQDSPACRHMSSMQQTAEVCQTPYSMAAHCSARRCSDYG